MLRVLVIDEDPAVGAVLQRALIHDEVVVETDAMSGVARFASAELEGVPFDVVMCDVRMHGMTGSDVLAAVRARREPPIFLLMADQNERAEATSADAVLIKPFHVRDVYELVETIREVRSHATTLACPRLVAIA